MPNVSQTRRASTTVPTALEAQANATTVAIADGFTPFSTTGGTTAGVQAVRDSGLCVTGFEALRATGHYPINHLMVVKDETLARNPGLAVALFEAFAEAKRRYVEKLASGAIAQPTAVDTMYKRVMDITGRDPLPYGLEPNRAMLEMAIGNAFEQGILTRRVALEDLFPRETHGLIA